MSAMASVPGALGEVWSIGDCKEPPGPRDDGAGSAFVLSVVHREVGVDAGEASLMLVHINMLQAEKTDMAYAFTR